MHILYSYFLHMIIRLTACSRVFNCMQSKFQLEVTGAVNANDSPRIKSGYRHFILILGTVYKSHLLYSIVIGMELSTLSFLASVKWHTKRSNVCASILTSTNTLNSWALRTVILTTPSVVSGMPGAHRPYFRHPGFTVRAGVTQPPAPWVIASHIVASSGLPPALAPPSPFAIRLHRRWKLPHSTNTRYGPWLGLRRR